MGTRNGKQLLRVLLAVLLAGVLMTATAAGTVRIATTLAPNTLQPAEATGLPDATVLRTMLEGLVGFRDDELVGELAESWTVNDDATEYTFELREGVTFHDGTPFNAEAVRDYYDWVMDPDSIGTRGRNQLEDLETVEVVDDHTVTLHLSQPNGAFLFLLAIGPARTASPASLDEYGEDVRENPVGTGPFRFVSWEEGQRVIVERNDDYWGEPARVDSVEFLVVTNAATRVAMLQSGEVHFIEQ
ncbi:MAG TPA: ABC transporter substrate-binding protein, partial [Deinococcales bacterium]|nr:ABC transporter substrate-binding protein [Deinococcales bacterium]